VLSRRYVALALLVFTVVGLLAYSAVLDAYFLSDDFNWLERARSSHPFDTAQRVAPRFFRPVVAATWLLDETLYGAQPLGHHLTNLFGHVLNACLVMIVASQLTIRGRSRARRVPVLPFFCGLLFLLLPCHAESVAWLSGRVDVVAAFFGLGALALYLHFVQQPRAWRLLASCIAFALALLSKEVAVSIPLLIVAHQLILMSDLREGRRWVSFAKTLTPYAATLLAYLLLRWSQLGTLVGGYGTDVHLQLEAGALLQLVQVGSVKALRARLPVGVTLDAVLLGGALALFTGLAVARLLRMPAEQRAATVATLGFLGIAYLISLSPMLNLPLSAATREGDRLLYLPSAFASMGLVHLIWVGFPRPRQAVVLLSALLVVYAAGLLRANRAWGVAGEISRELVGGIARVARSDEILFVSLPDNVGGAYVFRNGFPAAIRTVLAHKGFTTARFAATHLALGRRDRVTLRGLPQDRYAFRLSEPEAVVVSFKRRAVRGIASIENPKRRGFDLQLLPGARTFDVLYFSSGKVRALER
jgi:hypothetical protein